MQVSREVLEFLGRTNTCTVSNAIEALNVRMRNEGFIHGRLRCMFPEMPPVAGYAVTARMSAGAPPITGLCYYQRVDFWRYVASIPGPKIMVIRDIDRTPGIGALAGELHAQIGRALGAVAWVTNGAIRDFEQIRQAGVQCFAETTTVSHAYAHIVDFGEAVDIDGLKVKPGDLLHGDVNGVHCVPSDVADRLPGLVKDIQEREAELIRFCQSPEFSMDKLERVLGKAAPWSQTVEVR